MKTLCIKSIDTHTSLEIRPHDCSEGYSTCELEASFSSGGNHYCLRNTDIHFFDISEFANSLDEFILNRRIKPILNGTYGTFIEFFGTGNQIWIKLNIGLTNTVDNRFTHDNNIKATFQLNGDVINEINLFFSSLEKRCSS